MDPITIGIVTGVGTGVTVILNVVAGALGAKAPSWLKIVAGLFGDIFPNPMFNATRAAAALPPVVGSTVTK